MVHSLLFQPKPIHAQLNFPPSRSVCGGQSVFQILNAFCHNLHVTLLTLDLVYHLPLAISPLAFSCVVLLPMSYVIMIIT